jgi:hypothetical protein
MIATPNHRLLYTLYTVASTSAVVLVALASIPSCTSSPRLFNRTILSFRGIAKASTAYSSSESWSGDVDLWRRGRRKSSEATAATAHPFSRVRAGNRVARDLLAT